MDIKAWHRNNINRFRILRGKLGGKILGSSPYSLPYSTHQVEKILLLRNDNKLGDSVVSSPLLRGLRKLFPTADIDVVAGPTNAQIFYYHPLVRKIIVASRGLGSLFKTSWKLRKEKYDLYLDLDKIPTFSSLLFLKILRPRWAVGFNRENFPLYNLNIELDISSLHITGRQKALLHELDPFRRDDFDSSYELFYKDPFPQETNTFLENLSGKKILLINPLAASKHRSFTVSQIEYLAQNQEFSQTKIILVGSSSKLKKWLYNHTLPSNCYVFDKQIFQAIAIAKRATLLITPDTFWVHVACALKIPTLSVYHWEGNPSGPYKGNVAEWRPLEPCVKMLLRPEKQPKIPPVILLEEARKAWRDVTEQ